ncbi:calcium-binding protein [Phenylobacterium sp. J367]|uniref:calcium-binding protein n=1 Tax=Phenylobacterium sp. J367 TaxID=2898435 RepID=UPI002150769D|nr:calcium-binding protein [Phenylobacterium sp. J367]MCR5878707.1 calcium-binding protein [Phenylobacterium sp. J367]
MSTGNYGDLLRALGQNESGNNYAFVSSVGYLGRFQFGEEALKAIGFYEGHDGTGEIDFIGRWTAKAASYGVYDKASFLASPAAQDAAQQAWFENVHADLIALDIVKYIGDWVAGSQVTMSGLIAGAHLVGVWNLKDFLTSGGAIDTRDPYGTPVSQYVSKFAGYDTPWSSSTSVQSPAGPTSGDDVLIGSDATDILHGGDGRDWISGGGAFDDLHGNAGDDTISGGGGDDWVVGGRGADVLAGDDGHDVVLGNMGDDTAAGGAGNDIVRGGQGDDFVQGGDGDDWLSGDRGNDVLIGGAGADTFHFFAEAGSDRILDFHYAAGDRVDVMDGGYAVAQIGADVVLTLDSGAQLTLVNVSLSSFGSDWIV